MLAQDINEYAKALAYALYELAKEFNEEEKNLQELVFLKKYLKTNTEIRDFLFNNDNSLENKKAIFEEIAKFKAFSSYFTNWLFIIIDKGQSKRLSFFLKLALSVFYEKSNYEEVQIYTANALNEATLLKLEKQISTSLNSKIILTNKVKKELIAGYELIIRGKKIANNLNSSLDQFAQSILKEQNNVK
ncbi:ATP synthase F1 subunit delta [Mycoplasmopsis agassizii]|uniref:ATP synthase subunit delta n=1 Tax=Mycoplasmopsis agassizii TaxID=33922 RepID=A0A269TIM9_9BACT|nr:ATP synthase F1 subunit delta [Mycoplasmopsis agassizii]PAK21247.1 ATP synthase F1 subunit delta [Mycoplasmopsis agassizii]